MYQGRTSELNNSVPLTHTHELSITRKAREVYHKVFPGKKIFLKEI